MTKSILEEYEELPFVKNVDEKWMWEWCLKLWKWLSENDIPTKPYKDTANAKMYAFMKLKIETRVMFDCTFCHWTKVTATDKIREDCCVRCPIYRDPLLKIDMDDCSRCYLTPYGDWEWSGRHRKDKARLFYEYLLDLKQRWDSGEVPVR